MQPAEWDLPQLKTTVRMRGNGETDAFFAVQFYPYTAPGIDPVFAVTGGCETLICRAQREGPKTVEVVRWFRDDDPDASLNSCAWTKDPETGHPLLCVAGSDSRIRVLDTITGTLLKTLVGHGGEIEDLAISPKSSLLLASASEDRTLRVWSLDPKHEDQPCACICAGEGHKETVLTLAFHATGRYVLSGGMDCIVNLWVLPGLPDEHTGTDKPSVIHYPHFSTSAVHSDFVDCVMFHGDLILSKCAREGKIVLWRIEGFSSTAPAPPPHAAPTTHTSRETRSAFGSGGYQRLLQFHVPHTEPFYMRFGLLQGQPQAHPVLAMGNAKSKVFLWDFAQLEAWSATAGPTLPFRVPVTKSHHAGGGGGSRSGTTSGLAQREGSIASTTSSSLVSRGGTAATSDAAQPSKMHDLGDPAGELLAHATATIPNIWFCARQAAWSVGGDWLVVVGDHRVIAVFGRWDKDRPEGKS